MLIQEGGVHWAEWTTVGRVAPGKQQEEESCVPQLAMRTMTASRPLSWSIGSMGKQGRAEQSGSGVPVQGSRGPHSRERGGQEDGLRGADR